MSKFIELLIKVLSIELMLGSLGAWISLQPHHFRFVFKIVEWNKKEKKASGSNAFLLFLAFKMLYFHILSMSISFVSELEHEMHVNLWWTIVVDISNPNKGFSLVFLVLDFIFLKI